MPAAPRALGASRSDSVDAIGGRRESRELPNADVIALAAETLRVLADPTRLRLVEVLARRELSVGDLALAVSASRSTTSHSLRALRQLGLIRHRRAGKLTYYRLDDADVAKLAQLALGHAARRNPAR